MGRKLSPTTVFILKGLIPYTNENLMLSYSPNRFFNELERRSAYNRKQIHGAYYRAKKQKLISDDKIPQLTTKGRFKLQPYIASKLGKDARLMIVFDIPEQYAYKRRQLRTLLRELKFEQIQLSVWVTKYDNKDIMIEACSDLGLESFVQLHETVLLFS